MQNKDSKNPQSMATYQQSESQMEEAGSVHEEIEAIQNSIRYPLDALEQGLESECEWLVYVGNEGKYEKLVLTKPCSYKIFEEEVQKSIYSWKFKSPAGSKLELPIRFRITKEKE